MFLADKDDGLGDARAVMKMEMAKHHAETINKMLLKDIQYRSTTLNDFDSIDRITSSPKIEKQSTFSDVASGDHDQYNISRPEGSTQQWYDANVDAGTAGAERH